ncbi:putative clathrin assembly protein [Carex littledalei]|uniref:Putative clathrin assembly protein n=1 Tax=Carex littledalei TaxID=544730 RepID=A0A833QKI8_9POAL|nr:putative clathrin assembly protein [Carex littledalei]
MTSPREWWRRAAAAIKDRQSLYLTRLITGSSRFRNAELEAAVIRATSHDDRSVDYKNAARVFAWARTSPSFLLPVMWALARRAARTRSWPVALKTLMLIHGILMRSDSEPVDSKVGRLPFDLSEFKDRSSSPAKASAFSAFVRAYFNFLDSRSVFAGLEYDLTDEDQLLDRVHKLQLLLDLLMQIRPYGNGMEVGLVLEAMNCVLIEIFEVYSQICKGVASFLVNVFGSDHNPKSEFCLNECGNLSPKAKMRTGIVGVRVLRKATEQSSQLSAYFELCRSLGVLNAAELPEVEKIPEEDIQDLEMLLLGEAEEEEERREIESPVQQELEYLEVSPGAQLIETPVEQTQGEEGRAVMSEEWVIFEDDLNERQCHFGKEKSEEGFLVDNFSVQAGKPWRSSPWPSLMSPSGGMPFANNRNLIELI